MKSGACAPRSASTRMRSSDDGSAHCRSSNASVTGCERALAQNPGDERGECRRRSSSGVSVGLRLGGKGMSTRGARSVHLDCVEADEAKRLLEIGEALFGRQISAKSLPTPLGEWMERCVLQQLRRRPLDPSVWCLAESRAELLDQPRLANTGLVKGSPGSPLDTTRPTPASPLRSTRP